MTSTVHNSSCLSVQIDTPNLSSYNDPMADSQNRVSPNDAGQTSPSLLDGLRANADSAWRRFFETYRPVILFWVLRKIPNRDTANDIVQNVLVSVHRNISTFELQDGIAKFRAWLKTITQRKVADYYRQQKEQASGGTEALVALGQHEQPSDTDSDDLLTELKILARAKAAVLKTHFREMTWQSFWRTTIDGMDANQVAEELGISHASVRKNKSRVTKKLQDGLKDLGVLEFLGLEVSQLNDLFSKKRNHTHTPSEN